MEGILHVYHPSRQLLLFQHIHRAASPSSRASVSNNTSPKQPPNTLLFIGGLYDNFLNPSYTKDLSALFPSSQNQKWCLMHAQLSSAGRAFGTNDLDKDIEEIAVAVNFIRQHLHPSPSPSSPQSNIVLLGHSTGCQDLLHYLHSPNPISPNKPARPPVQGAILQAPVSDREATMDNINADPIKKSFYAQALAFADSTPKDQHRHTLVPMNIIKPFFGAVPYTVSRFLSLASPFSPTNPGPDDLFSSDATDAWLSSTFGTVGKRQLLQPVQPLQPSNNNTSVSVSPTILALISDADEHVHESIDKHALLSRWAAAMKGTPATLHKNSKCIPHARHGIDGDSHECKWARMVVFRREVLTYLDEVVGDVGTEAWEILKRDERVLEEEEEKQASSGAGAGAGAGGNDSGGVEKSVGNLKL